jgi:hypothetical protein
MLSDKQAREIVDASIGKTIRRSESISPDQTLEDFGITEDMLGSLVTTLSADVEVGVPRFQHYLDPNIIGDLGPGISIKDLTDKILKLSAGKLCSNPNTPHPQKCCPYPTKCPQCGYPVL